jgi:hypothetical protein
MKRGLGVVCLGLLIVVGAGCGEDTVHAAESCPVMGCGGDVVGEWDIVGACVIAEDCSDESGTVSGTFSFTADGYSYESLIETTGCGFINESSSSGGGSYRAEGNFLYPATGDEPIYEYCVDADVMELTDLSEFGGERFTLQRRAE